MLASVNLLRKYVDLNGITDKEIADKLTFAGLEVEGMSHLAEATNLIIGKILSVEKHPDSDHLHVLQVDEGPKEGIHQIVCGAPNVKVGLKVIVARKGAKLGTEGIVINPSKIRGVESDGMCCALNELGVNKMFLTEKQISGIEELPEDAPVGNEDVLSYLGLEDTILDINVLPNRSDCLAIFSLAKELAALFDRKITIPDVKKFDEVESDVKVTSKTENCPQFSIKVVRDVKTKPSPKWLSAFLMSEGIRSINNIVDIGNFVMILTGQPLHMYDLDKVPNHEFEVVDDVEEEFVALDEKSYKITPGDLVIKVGGKSSCLAGVMGALYCAVDENTKDIAIESANFKGAKIRRTTVKTGLSSDSSSHFIKGINPYQDRYVLDLTSMLLVELADAKIVEKTVRYSTINENLPRIDCSVDYINKRLGTNFNYEEISTVLTKLGIKIENVDGNKFVAIPPEHRIDIRYDADLSEEVIRFVGFDKIKSTLPLMETTVGGYTPFQRKRKDIREMLIFSGLHEVLTYNLISPKMNSEFVCLNNDEPYLIMNPMTIDHSVVRRGLISSLLDVVKYNQSHQVKDVNIFEVSDVITKSQSYSDLTIVLCGSKSIRHNLERRPYDFYDLHGYFEAIMHLLGIDKNRYKEVRLSSPFFHPGRSTQILFGKQVVGVIGQLYPTLTKDYGEVYAMELNLSALINLKVSPSKMKPISKYPSVTHDLALVVKKDVLGDDIIRCIKKASKSLVNEVNVFDVYEGEHMIIGMKSIAVSITYTDFNKTLVDTDIETCENNIKLSLKKEFNAELRK